MFTQSLLCKASNSTISVNRLFEKIDWTTYTYTWTIRSDSAYTYITVPISSSSTYSIYIQSISWKVDYNWLGWKFWIYIDNTRYDNYAYTLREWYWPYTCNLSNLPWWNNLYFKLNNDYSNQTFSTTTVTHSDIIINETMNISKPSWDTVLYRDVVWLGKLCWITILWYHTDWERIDHGNWWWLPVEFVEKIEWTTSWTSFISPKTYDYDTFLVWFIKNNWYCVGCYFAFNWWWTWIPDSSSSYIQRPMSSSFCPANYQFMLNRANWNSWDSATIYVFRVNRPS